MILFFVAWEIGLPTKLLRDSNTSLRRILLGLLFDTPLLLMGHAGQVQWLVFSAKKKQHFH
jgi:hypothetical protein